MLLLVNTNRMQPPIAPIGIDYLAGAARAAGIPATVVDLCLEEDPSAALRAGLARGPALVALSFRNIDDSFWPSMRSFLPDLQRVVEEVRAESEAPIVLGGVGFSIMPREILGATGAEYGVHGDGEESLVALYREVTGTVARGKAPGVIRRSGRGWKESPPDRRRHFTCATDRDAVDNPAYFARGGQVGIETKRGCDRLCLYCADPLAKGRVVRTRAASETADEAEALVRQGIDVLHLCDGEFNLPREHAMAVCEAWAARGLGERLRWYAYLAIDPFDAELAAALRRAGCVGVNFTTDSAAAPMLKRYGHAWRAPDIGRAVRAARTAGLAVMLDLLIGGPGETPETVAETIGFLKGLPVDAVGCGVGVRVYPGTPMESVARREPGALRRRHGGELDLLQPTFYIAESLGDRPAELVRELIGDDPRFFKPADDSGSAHNYSDNAVLVEAIAAGARGAYWDILRRRAAGAPGASG